MSLKETVVKWVDELVAETGCYVVDIVVSDSKIRRKITVFLDSDVGITIDECSAFSRTLGNQLEEIIDEAFTLEVSSPGADSPLRLERQYRKNIGRSLRITKTDKTEIKGKLLEVNNDAVLIEPEAKKKVKQEVVTVLFEEIQEAKVIISFK
ncbi:MAG: ribosome maturation factor RimP [Leadbetterella sp.]|nr:ribosome maturation factor RimP [Leadbetterella sp.]